MYKINAYTFKVCRTVLGGFVYYTHRSNSTYHFCSTAPVWIEALEKECNKTVYNRVQCLININIAKAFRTTSNEALCTLTGLIPIAIKAEEAAKLYNTMRKVKSTRSNTKHSQKTDFTQQTQSQSPNNKMNTQHKYIQTAA
jgi:hypothetical protein